MNIKKLIKEFNYFTVIIGIVVAVVILFNI